MQPLHRFIVYEIYFRIQIHKKGENTQNNHLHRPVQRYLGDSKGLTTTYYYYTGREPR